jgi:hypothetical protein
VKGFGRRPQHDRWCRCGAGVRKPPREETAVRKGAGAVRTIYGDLRVTGCRRWPFERRLIERSQDLLTRGGCGVAGGISSGLSWALAWRSDNDLQQNSCALANGQRRRGAALQRGGWPDIDHEVPILIRLREGGAARRPLRTFRRRSCVRRSMGTDAKDRVVLRLGSCRMRRLDGLASSW